MAHSHLTLDLTALGGTSMEVDIVGGIKAPFSVVTTSPLQTVPIRLSQMVVNATVDDAVFSLNGK